MMLHGSDLVRMQKCPRLAWLEYHHRQESSLPFYNMEDSFSSLWARAYDLQDTPRGQRGDSMEDSFRILDSLAPGESARFIRIVYRDLRITIPWIRKLEDGWEAIWPMFTARESEAWVMKLARLAAAANGIDIRRQEAVFLNRSYVRQESLDTGKLFIKSDCLENRKHHLTSSIEDLQADLDVDPDRLIDEACSLFSGPCPKAVNSRHCALGKRCRHYESCFRTDLRPGDDTIFLRTLPGRFSLPEGSMADLDPAGLENYPTAFGQYQAARHNPWIDREGLRQWMQDAVHPYSYLDFEWDTFAVPPYRGMKPADVLCFQFSLHTETEEGLDHASFFGWGDCRRAFIQRLLETVPKEGTIFVYNMEGAEALRLRQLARQFPEYAEPLQEIWERMKDLSKPFENGLYYNLRMKGRFSLKQVVTLFTDDPVYSSLAIHDGLQAVRAYREYETADPGTRERIMEELDRYCQMDTYAEYLVLKGLEKVMEE